MSKIIRILMKPLDKYFAQKDVTEIISVDGGYVGLKRDNSEWDYVKDDDVSYEFWERLVDVLANINGEVFDEVQQPRLSAVLPDGHRIEAMLGKNVATKLSVTIRVKRNIKLTLADFGLSGDYAKKIINLLRKGVNLIISGGTGSGKTSLLNVFIQYIQSDDSKKVRIITVEDTREIDLPDPSVSPQYVVSRNEKNAVIGSSEIIDHVVRSNPTYIILGEISVKNTYPALRMLNTGHRGFLCTVHANSPLAAIQKAFPQNVEMSGYDAKNVASWLSDSEDPMVDVVIQLGDDCKINEIYYTKTGESKRFADSKSSNKHLELVI